MKRGGVFALITYILYTLFFGGIVLLFTSAFRDADGGTDNSANVVVAIAYLLFTVLAVAGLFAVILKLLHMTRGWFVCGVFCAIIDFNLIWSIISVIIQIGAVNEVTIVLLVPLAFAMGALISNIKSLKN